MKIVMLHDLDTGFLAQTLKPAFKKLGHECVICQTVKTYLDGTDGKHIDYLMGKMEDIDELKEVFEDTDLFILRSLTDITLRLTGVLDYTNEHNTIYRIHGSEFREKRVPYSLKTWQINWHGKEPMVVGPRDPSLLREYEGSVITSIERPIDLSLFKDIEDIDTEHESYVLTTPTNMQRKGIDELMKVWNSVIPLQVVHGVSRKEVLSYKKKANYYIDRIGSYEHGPYGMNSVEAWILKIPVFSEYNAMDRVVCPELHRLVNFTNINNVQDDIESYEYDEESIEYAYRYAIDTHNPLIIAKQYIDLGNSMYVSR